MLGRLFARSGHVVISSSCKSLRKSIKTMPTKNTVYSEVLPDICQTVIKNRNINIKEWVDLEAPFDCEGMITFSNNIFSRAPFDNAEKSKTLRAIGVLGGSIHEEQLKIASERGIAVVRANNLHDIPRDSLVVEQLVDFLVGHEKFTGKQLAGKTIGLIGMGKMGQRTATWCKGFNMNVVCFDELLSRPCLSETGVSSVGLKELYELSDIILVNTPLTKRTKGLVDAEALTHCKRGAYIINCSKADVIDEVALLAALETKHIAGAAVDFAEVLPTSKQTSSLRAHPAVKVAPLPGSTSFDLQTDFYRVTEHELFGNLQMSEMFQVAQGVCDVLNGVGSGTVVNAPNANAVAARLENRPFLPYAKAAGSKIASLILGEKLRLMYIDITVTSPDTYTGWELGYLVQATATKSLLEGLGMEVRGLTDALNQAETMNLEVHIHVVPPPLNVPAGSREQSVLDNHLVSVQAYTRTPSGPQKHQWDF